MNENRINSCSFTGHRQIESGHKPVLADLILRAIGYAYSQGCRKFYCGGALGFDTLAARQVILFKMGNSDCELHLLLPCINQDAKWTDEERWVYEHTLSSADTVTYISDEYTKDCMRKRNSELVRRADMLIAYSSREWSGSGQTVRMAKEKGIPVYNLFAHCEKALGDKPR